MNGLLGASSFPVKMESMASAMSSLPSSSFAWPNSYWQSFQAQSQAAMYPNPYTAAYSQYYGQNSSGIAATSPTTAAAASAAVYGAY